jgi:hypothetical protein
MNATILDNTPHVLFFCVISVSLMSYACHNVTQLDGHEANIFIVISSVGMSFSINHVVKTRRCSFIIQESVWSLLCLRSSDKCSSMYGPAIASYCNTLKCAPLTKL